MARQLLDLYKREKSELFRLDQQIYLETRGILDPKRVAALALASPDPVGGVLGATVAGLIGGRAERPTDTIFPSDKFFAKPVTLLRPTQALSLEAVDENRAYYVKMNPSPALLGSFSKLKNTLTNPGALQSAAINALNKFGSKKAAGKFLEGLKNPSNRGERFGKQYMSDAKGKSMKEDRLYSTHYYDGSQFKLREKTNGTGFTKYVGRKGENGGIPYKSALDNINSELITIMGGTENSIKDFLNEKQSKLNTPYVSFKVYGDEDEQRQLIFPATVSGLNEEFTPAISNFKYVGSPFSLYRYGGVERTIRFNLKLYYQTDFEKISVIKKLNLLREYVFPDRKLSAIKYNGVDEYSPILFNPNILKLTIFGLYNDLTCIMDNLSFEIDDNTSWSDTNNWDGTVSKTDLKPFPSVIDVAISVKVIETPSIKEDNGAFTYEYGQSETQKYSNYFTKYNEYTLEYTKAAKEDVERASEGLGVPLDDGGEQLLPETGEGSAAWFRGD